MFLIGTNSVVVCVTPGRRLGGTLYMEKLFPVICIFVERLFSFMHEVLNSDMPNGLQKGDSVRHYTQKDFSLLYIYVQKDDPPFSIHAVLNLDMPNGHQKGDSVRHYTQKDFSLLYIHVQKDFPPFCIHAVLISDMLNGHHEGDSVRHCKRLFSYIYRKAFILSVIHAVLNLDMPNGHQKGDSVRHYI